MFLPTFWKIKTVDKLGVDEMDVDKIGEDKTGSRPFKLSSLNRFFHSKICNSNFG